MNSCIRVCVGRPIPENTKILRNKIKNKKLFRTVDITNSKYINETCLICHNDYKYNSIVYILNCNHIYHKDCLDKWYEYKKTCPICR